MKKIFSLLWGISIVALSAISCTFAYTQEQQEAYQWAYKYGITTQPTIEAANLNWNLTRQAFAKMVVNYLENVVWVKQATSNSCYFPDESKITNDLKPYAKKTCSYKIMWSNGTAFKPTDSVDRAQLWTVLSRILWGDEYNNNWKWYYIYHLNALKQNWIMNNINNPQAYAKRWDVLIMLKRTYEKFGSNVYMNGNQSTSYSNTNINQPSVNNEPSITPIQIDDNSYESYNMYSDSSVVYVWKDGREYNYDADFLTFLKDEANKKWESDLNKYLEIEAKYYVNWLDQLDSLDLDNLPEMLGIDEDIDPETMTKKEKEALLKKIKDWVNKIIKENKDRNDEYVEKLQKVIKNIKNDKFWLKDKYNKTKEFMDTTDSFLVLYSEIIFEVLEIALTSEDWEIDEETWMGIAFWLMAAALAYEGEAEEYQWYLENWADNATKILIDGVDPSKVTRKDTSDDSNSLLRANQRAKDVARKNDLSQIQTAIVTSQQDKWEWPGMNKNATKWMSVWAISTELINAWMSQVPSDPDSKNSVSGLWEIKTTMWEYSYIVTKRNWYNNWWFVVMANTETEWWSNWIVCNNKNMGLENWYINNDTDLKDIKVCTEFKKWNSCSTSACTYTSEDELRYIVIY